MNKETLRADKENQTLDVLSQKAQECSYISPELYTQYEVKRGLRDISGRGVLAGLTEIGEVYGYKIENGEMIPDAGKLMYRGMSVADLVDGFVSENRFGFEEICYLLLFGELPTEKEYAHFSSLLKSYRELPEEFVRDMIMNAPSKDMMNVLSRSVLTLYSYDPDSDNNEIRNVLRQCLQLISCFPMLAVYGYQAHKHYHDNKSLVIHSPNPDLSLAENFLYMLRADKSYTQLEATLLDLALVLHAEHGGGNNSSFVTHVATSSYTDTYSVIAAALGCLKGSRHGGANIKVVQMFEEIKNNVKDWKDDEEISHYLDLILNKKAFDHSGLIYGVGHAVYSVSDPRAVLFKEHVKQLAKEKGLDEEFQLYSNVERLAPEVIGHSRKIYKGVSVNVDFYSGFVYRMLDIPLELYTPIFAIARIVGWSAHRIEEIANKGKIIRPAYKCIMPRRSYKKMSQR